MEKGEVGGISCMEGKRNEYIILIRSPKGKTYLGRAWMRDNIGIDLMEMSVTEWTGRIDKKKKVVVSDNGIPCSAKVGCVFIGRATTNFQGKLCTIKKTASAVYRRLLCRIFPADVALLYDVP
jgi:hypothetical protein